jgi:predicted nucleotide-binding protein (sugar kinase/HSP70/actin superfamily)
MKFTIPHMGKLDIVCKAILEMLGQEVILPPPPSKKTLSLGVRYSPELVCLPFKVNVGNFIEALEQGADTIVMIGGCNGPCRFGYYGTVQKPILESLGYKFRMIYFDNPSIKDIRYKMNLLFGGKPIWKVAQALSFGWKLLNLLEEIDVLAHKTRARELRRGDTTKAYEKAVVLAESASTPDSLRKASSEVLAMFEQIPKNKNDQPLLRVGIVGEIYTVLEPFVNLDVEKHLGEMGVEVHRAVWLSSWLRHSLHIDRWDPKGRGAAVAAAAPYLRHHAGGESTVSVGATARFARHGYDGVVHLMPFTCMPEVIAQGILSKVSRDLDIPVLTFILDEHSAQAGMMTRLEAFVDLLTRRREREVRD